MKNLIYLSTVYLLTLSSCTQTNTIGEMEFSDGEIQHTVLSKSAIWTSCPPHLPKGCELIVLEGSPKKKDLFSVRFKLSKGFKMPAHTHPKDERVTILEGKVAVSFDLDNNLDSVTYFGAGDYYVNKRGIVHTVWTDTNSIIQITGIGPWEADFITQ